MYHLMPMLYRCYTYMYYTYASYSIADICYNMLYALLHYIQILCVCPYYMLRGHVARNQNNQDSLHWATYYRTHNASIFNDKTISVSTVNYIYAPRTQLLRVNALVTWQWTSLSLVNELIGVLPWCIIGSWRLGSPFPHFKGKTTLNRLTIILLVVFWRDVKIYSLINQSRYVYKNIRVIFTTECGHKFSGNLM